jgi:HAD superfamily hydrolase (TIGR01509 family)
MTALLFDLDGTLADTNPLHSQAWCETLTAHGFTADDSTYARRIAGRRNTEIVKSLLPHLAAEAALRVAEQKEVRFRALAGSSLQALPGVAAIVALARERGWLTALVTNAPRANAQHVMTSLGLHFGVAVFGEDLPHGKPDPAPYLEALRQLGITAGEAIAFEDSPSGVNASVAAQIATVGILSGHTSDELRAAGATLCVADFAAAELRHWLEQRAK